jgi:hypothetical protein
VLRVFNLSVFLFVCREVRIKWVGLNVLTGKHRVERFNECLKLESITYYRAFYYFLRYVDDWRDIGLTAAVNKHLAIDGSASVNEHFYVTIHAVCTFKNAFNADAADACVCVFVYVCVCVCVSDCVVLQGYVNKIKEAAEDASKAAAAADAAAAAAAAAASKPAKPLSFRERVNKFKKDGFIGMQIPLKLPIIEASKKFKDKVWTEKVEEIVDYTSCRVGYVFPQTDLPKSLYKAVITPQLVAFMTEYLVLNHSSCILFRDRLRARCGLCSLLTDCTCV